MWPLWWRRRPARPPLADPPAWMVREVRRRTGKPADECRRVLTRPTLGEYLALTGDGPDGFGDRDPAEVDVAAAPSLIRATLEAEREAGPDGGDGHCFGCGRPSGGSSAGGTGSAGGTRRT